MSRFKRYLKRKEFIKQMSAPLTLYIKDGDIWKPIATLDSKDFNPKDLYEEPKIDIFANNPITVSFQANFIIPTQIDYSDLDSTLNTLGILLESDLEEGE